MSADNWATCPRCLGHAKTEARATERAVAALYGKVPIAEFDRRRAELAPVEEGKFATFREDYQIGLRDGRVDVNYSGACTKCGLAMQLVVFKRLWDSIALAPADDPLTVTEQAVRG